MPSRPCGARLALLGLALLGLSLLGYSAAARAQTTAPGRPPAQPGDMATVAGTVYDSVAGAPLVRAVVQLMAATAARTTYTATTDSMGHYQLSGVPAGSYLATFFHPALDALGLEPALRRVAVGDAAAGTRLDFAIPAPRTVWIVNCRPADPTDSTGLLLGQVTAAATGAPVAGGEVTAHWSELVLEPGHGLRTVPHTVTAEADGAGRYAICGVPADGSVQVHAAHAGAVSGTLLATVPARGLLQLPLAISTSAQRVVLRADSAGLDSGTVLVRGTARLAGTVRSETGQPMANVELRLLGTGLQGRTATDGTFLLTDLPAGSYMLETRRLGLAPAQVAVTLASGRTAHVAVQVHEAVVLSTQTIYGKAHANQAMERLSGFLHRQRTGWGHFLTRADIERRQPFNTSDLFRGMLGVRVRRAGVFESAVRMRNPLGGWCQPNVFLDGTPLIRNFGIGAGGMPLPGASSSSPPMGSIDDWIPNADDVAAVEVYPEQMMAPAQFRGTHCGSVVIWSTYAFPAVPANP